MKPFVLFFSLLLSVVYGQSVQQDRFWIFFTDKSGVAAEPALSARALANRTRQGIAPDHHDLPVSAAYRSQLLQAGVQIRQVSRWFNAVSAPLSPAQQAQVLALPFVARIQPVAKLTVSRHTEAAQNQADGYDTPNRQLSIVLLDSLHSLGYTGQGVLMAVFDNGFDSVDSMGVFSTLHARNGILTTRDYVGNDNDVYETCGWGACQHGTHCFSMIAANAPGTLVGSAPDADFILLRTENDDSETNQEEDNWVAAAEYADSLGAQVFSTSLGYSTMDPGAVSYSQSDMNGDIAIITRAADLAASRGIIVVNSAGNNGLAGISAPADGDSVIAVGATDQYGAYSSYSSVGPSADGRVKPDVCTMGSMNFYARPDNSIGRGSGTSYSCPIMAGLAACLLQAAPNTTNMQMRDALIRSADHFSVPDIYYGYGIPNGIQALQILQSTAIEPTVKVIGNPNVGTFYVAIPSLQAAEAEYNVFDAAGKKVFSQLLPVSSMTEVRIPDVAAGLYYLVVKAAGQSWATPVQIK